MKWSPEAVDAPPKRLVAPSGYVRTGVGLHPHESPLPAWAVELTLGPKIVFDYPGPDALALRISPGWGMDYNPERSLEHFGLLEFGVAAELMRFFSLEYMLGGQVGTFAGRVEPAFRHGAALRFWYVIGPELQHYVTGPSASNDGRPRQVVRILLSFDLACTIYRATGGDAGG